MTNLAIPHGIIRKNKGPHPGYFDLPGGLGHLTKNEDHTNHLLPHCYPITMHNTGLAYYSAMLLHKLFYRLYFGFCPPIRWNFHTGQGIKFLLCPSSSSVRYLSLIVHCSQIFLSHCSHSRYFFLFPDHPQSSEPRWLILTTLFMVVKPSLEFSPILDDSCYLSWWIMFFDPTDSRQGLHILILACSSLDLTSAFTVNVNSIIYSLL